MPAWQRLVAKDRSMQMQPEPSGYLAQADAAAEAANAAAAGVVAAFAAAAAAIPKIESKVRGCTYLDIEQ